MQVALDEKAVTHIQQKGGRAAVDLLSYST